MSVETAPRRLSPRLMIAIFACFFAVLALGYFLFLRAAFIPVFSQLKPAEASAIVAQLDAKKIPYQLSDGGTTILVPDDQSDAARIAIAGSNVQLKGGVGFELFNKSDMGLTDFAQRINYQRALQGELERSIMMIEEVDTARVHLALPERAIFRSERSSVKAAVELVAKPGRLFDAARVAGVQQLVAFAVPDLNPTDVVVLDENGRVLSSAAAEAAFLSPEAEEQRAAQSYYRARARSAVKQVLPGLRAEVKVLTLATSGAAMPQAGASAGAARNFRLRVIVSTAAPVRAEDTDLMRNAISDAIALNEGAGDQLMFQVGLSPTPAPASRESVPAVAPLSVPAAPAMQGAPLSYWLLGGVLVLIAAALFMLRQRGGRLSATEREAMIERVRAALRRAEGDYADA